MPSCRLDSSTWPGRRRAETRPAGGRRALPNLCVTDRPSDDIRLIDYGFWSLQCVGFDLGQRSWVTCRSAAARRHAAPASTATLPTDRPAIGAATGASRVPSSSTTGSRRTTASSGWSSAPPHSGCSCRCCPSIGRRARPVDGPDAQLPDHRHLIDAAGPFDWPDATVASGDAVEIVRRMKEESDVPIRSHGSLRLNRALMAAGLVDRIQITVFPVISAQTGRRADLRGCRRLRPRPAGDPHPRRPHPGGPARLTCI